MAVLSAPTYLGTNRVSDVMHRGIVTCAPSTTLRAAARILAAHRIHAVVVADGDRQELSEYRGIVSDLDLIAAAVARPHGEQSVGALAVEPALVVRPEETIERAAQLMAEHAAAHLIVVEPASGRPVGILSTLDVAEALLV